MLQELLDSASGETVAGHPLRIIRRKAKVYCGECRGRARGPDEGTSLWYVQGCRNLAEGFSKGAGRGFQFIHRGRIAFEEGLGDLDDPDGEAQVSSEFRLLNKDKLGAATADINDQHWGSLQGLEPQGRGHAAFVLNLL